MNPLRRAPHAVYSVFDAEPLDGGQGDGWEQAMHGEGWEQAASADEQPVTQAQPAPAGEADAFTARPESAATPASATRLESAAMPAAAAAGREIAGGAGRAAGRLAIPILLCVVGALVVGLVASTILKSGPTRDGDVASASAGNTASASGTAHAGGPGRVADDRTQGRGVTGARRAASAASATSDASAVSARPARRGRVRVDRGSRLAARRLRSNAPDAGRVARQIAKQRNAAPAHVTYVAPSSLPDVTSSSFAYVASPSESAVLAPATPTPACTCASAVDEFGFER